MVVDRALWGHEEVHSGDVGSLVTTMWLPEVSVRYSWCLTHLPEPLCLGLCILVLGPWRGLCSSSGTDAEGVEHQTRQPITEEEPTLPWPW